MVVPVWVKFSLVILPPTTTAWIGLFLLLFIFSRNIFIQTEYLVLKGFS